MVRREKRLGSLLLILTGVVVYAQGPRSEPVAVPVTVKDAAGRLVGGLQAGEFRILEDGVEQKITGFSADPRPLAAAVLLDAVLTPPTAQRLRETFPVLVEAFSEFDEVAVFAFDSGFRAVADFTSERERLHKALRGVEIAITHGRAGEPLTQQVPRINNWPVGGAPPGPARSGSAGRPRKRIDDAVLSAVRLLEARDPGRRRIVLLISDGAQAARLDDTALAAALRKSDAAVYSVALELARLSPNSGVLARYGPPSGGEVFPATKKSALESLYARIAEQARYQYVLSYVPARPASVAPVWRTIEVRVQRPGLQVIARDGYIPEARPPRQ